jgi:predicted NAD-dependent protein-ADP-ribosyltransferase YbiA (DUF1768 family)
MVMADALLTVSVDKSRIVEEGNYHKFTKCQDSKHFTKMLLDTGDRELVEVSMIACHNMSNVC